MGGENRQPPSPCESIDCVCGNMKIVSYIVLTAIPFLGDRLTRLCAIIIYNSLEIVGIILPECSTR